MKIYILLIVLSTLLAPYGLAMSANSSRQANALNSSENGVIHVADYGAFPDDGKDDVRAIRAAIEAAKSKSLIQLVFDEGQYDFFPTFASERYIYISNNDEGLKRIAFDLGGISNLVIDGQGALFMFHGFISPFVVEDSSHVVFENFSVDFSRPFHSEGIILDYDKDSMDIEIGEGFPFEVTRGMLLFTDGVEQEGQLTTVSKGNFYGSSHMLEYDTEKRQTAFMVYDFYFRGINGFPATKLDGRKVRINVPGLSGTIGNTMCFGPNHRKHPGFVLTDSRDIKFYNITIHHSGGMGILGQRTHNIEIDHCKVTPSHGRMISTTADATHFVNCTGKISLTNNLFENQKDDATNIHGIYVQVIEIKGKDTVTVQLKHLQQHGFDFIEPGMELELVRGKSMITYATATVAAVKRINKECTEVTFVEALPDDIRIGDAMAEIRDYPEILIAKNIIRNNRARGMLLNSRGKTVVEDNYFHSPGAAILFEGDAHFWFEQGGVSDCVIRNNIFDNCLFGVWGNAVIDVKAGIREDKEIARYNRNILIENNTFRVFDDYTLLNVYSVDGLVWRNNKVEQTTAYPKTGNKGEPFVVAYSDNVEIDDERYEEN
jgi:hypothetical protein